MSHVLYEGTRTLEHTGIHLDAELVAAQVRWAASRMASFNGVRFGLHSRLPQK